MADLLDAFPKQMVQVETLMTGIVDKYKFLGKTKWTRLLTVLAVCSCGFMLGLAMTTQMVDVETVMSGLCDEFPALNKRRFPLLLVVSTVFFLFGLAQVTQGGMYVLQLMDHYSATFGCLIIAITECVAINWLYGNERFAANVKEMLGHYPKRWWRLCWKYIAPLLIVAILVFSFVQYKSARYGSYYYPMWADAIGWFMAMSSVAPIFIVMFVSIYRAEGNTFREKFNKAIQPQVDQDKPNPIEEKFLTPPKQKEAEALDKLETIDESDAQKRLMDTSAV